jgi:hypothetical protein
MRTLLLLAALFVFTANFNKSYATHIPGANITYTCDPANPLTYTFTLTLFRVCPGTHPATMSSTYFSLTNDCGLVNPVVPTFNQVGVEQDVNQLCATATSDCSGGTDPGLLMYTYEATITLPADCDSWTIAFDLCCRDQSTNMSGGTGNNMYTQTVMNTQTAPCNDSPVVTATPIPYACVNTAFNYCLTTSDPQGDSTVYTMIDPMGAAGAPIVFNAGYTAAQPIANFTLDPLTGCMTFTSPITGNFVVNVQIDSYDSNGNLICSVVHDFQVIVMSCTNTPPNNPAVGITNFSGTGTQLGSNNIGLCYGDNICFDVVFEDVTDPGDNITIQTDALTLLPGATFVQTGTNPATGTMCWTAQPGHTGSIITFTAEDDGCPVMGTSGFAVDLDIATGVYAGSDPTICGSQSATLDAYGATAFTWSPGTGLSCTNCPNPVASPAVTTTYTLTGNLVGTCPNTDQVTVNVVPDFTPTMNPMSQTICANEIAQLEIQAPGANGPYTYDWSPVTDLNDPTISNPLSTTVTSTTYTCTITSADGCVKTADADVIVSGVGPTVNIIPSDTTICPGETVDYTMTAQAIPVICGPSAGCTGTTTTVDLGAATTSSSTYSPFYGSSTTTDYTKKVQMIYTAAELNALGYSGGTIRDIAIYATTVANYRYDDVEIWIGCTSLDQFASSSFEPVGNLTQVYGPQDNLTLVNNGWTTFDINDWDWDGTSNLIVQFCSSEDNIENNNGITSCRYSSTSPAYRMVYDLSSIVASPSCNELLGTRTTSRTNMRFSICEADVVAPTYTWSPGATLSATNISNPTATPTANTTYVVNVTANGCTGSGSATINIDNSNSVQASNDVIWCVGDPPINLNAQYYLNGVPTSAATGANCYDQTITYTNGTGLIGNGGTNTFTFNGTPPVTTGGTLTINAYGDLDLTTELWTLYNELGAQIGTIGGSNTQCGYLHTITIPLAAVDLNAWTANGSIVFTATDVSGAINPTLCGVGVDLLEMQLQIDCPAGSGYTWAPAALLNDETLQDPTATSITGTTTFYVTATGTCDAIDSVVVTYCDPLPIELLEFNGYNKNDVNELFWTTVSQVNTDYFVVQKSINGIDFFDLTMVDGAGNSVEELGYRATDNDPFSGITYYRLKEFDFNGDYRYSDVIAINAIRGSDIQIYPNPTTNDLFIDFSNDLDEGMHTILISDVSGKVIAEQIEFNHTQKTYKIENFGDMTPGIYMIKVLDANNEMVKFEKITKQ